MTVSEQQEIKAKIKSWLEQAKRREAELWNHPEAPQRAEPITFIVALIGLAKEKQRINLDEFEKAVVNGYYNGLNGMAASVAEAILRITHHEIPSKEYHELLNDALAVPEINTRDSFWAMRGVVDAIGNTLPKKAHRDFIMKAHGRLNEISIKKGLNRYDSD